MEDLVGRQIKGFRFEAVYGCGYYKRMNNFIGKIGIIENKNDATVFVNFEDDSFWIPLDQIKQHLIPLEVFKLGQKVWDMSIQEEAGVVSDIDNSSEYPHFVEFNGNYHCYKIDGVNVHGQKTLSSAPYTFQGFSQETIIERGTLVYFRGYESSRWSIGFYDEFKHNKHFIFENQQKEGVSFPWTFCQTKNPLI